MPVAAKKQIHYENRVVAFIDILGFQGLIPIDDAGADQLAAALLAAIEIFEPFRPGGETKKTMGRTVTQFSDSIVLSFKETEASGVNFNLWLILHLHIRMIEFNTLIRGGVGIGKTVHSEKLLFGPSVIDAYLLEKSAANYPRIVVPPDIFALAKRYPGLHKSGAEEERELDNLVKQDADGLFYIDYFNAAASEVEYDTFYGYKLREIIIEGLKSNRVDIKVKYMWMKQKFNSSIWVGQFNVPIII